MKRLVIGIVVFGVLATTAMSGPNEVMYEGTWVTTNRQLDGNMTAAVTDLGNNKWRGHFYGIWQGVQFSYKVEFSGPPENLRGTAVVDDANYLWTGAISTQSPGWFKGTFGGDRYTGNFVLKQTSK